MLKISWMWNSQNRRSEKYTMTYLNVFLYVKLDHKDAVDRKRQHEVARIFFAFS